VELSAQTIHKVNLWVYFGNRSSSWHYDGHDNFLYLLSGKKTVYLAAPHTIASKNVFSLFNNHYEKARWSSPQMSNKVYKGTVRRGRCLFIPKGWWHKVHSEGNPSIALNFWINSVAELTNSLSTVDKQLLLKYLLFEVADEFCAKAVPQWDEMGES
jgi:ribosomal protein L16 Arg81 hydroxylase